MRTMRIPRLQPEPQARVVLLAQAGWALTHWLMQVDTCKHQRTPHHRQEADQTHLWWSPAPAAPTAADES
jgi:hypothetical protein